MLKLKLQYFGHLMRRVDLLEKTDAGRDWGQEEKGMTEDEMAGWHHWLDGHESERTPGVGDGQGSLACCSSWGRKESDMTDRLIWSDLNALLLLRNKNSGIRVAVMHTRLCLILCDHMDCSLPGSSVHGILQARILEWVTISSSQGSSHPRDGTHVSYVSCIGFSYD